MNTLRNCRPTITILIGIPGSGKSTYAKGFIEENTSIKYFSSDEIRKELWGDEGCQNNPNEVFHIMQVRTLEALKSGHDVIYDATNITRKSRRGILAQLPPYVVKKCVVVWAPIDDCLKRDFCRSRTVGAEVIWKMLKRFEAPYYDEGFDEIVLCNTNRDPRYYEKCKAAMKIPHDNPHHTLDVDEHCKRCGELLLKQEIPESIIVAGFLHDVGKPLTKTFTNTKGEVTDVAHYYGHQAVGAWMSYGFTETDLVTIAWAISTHMAPFINQKYYNSLDPIYKSWIDALHTADKEAH